MPEEDTPEDDFYSRIPVELNMGELLLDEHIKKGQGDRTAIHYLDNTVTYSWLKENANKAANAFEYLGLEIENRFMILLHDSPEFVVGSWRALGPPQEEREGHAGGVAGDRGHLLAGQGWLLLLLLSGQRR